ncbi:MAG: DUF3987 domain-containing protein [bacterium]|nr:DUF3987 domain-containing protein [bacterium]
MTNDANPLLDWAILYVRSGWPVFPVWHASADGCGCGNAECKRPGKHPIAACAPRGFQDATFDEEIVRRWWTSFPHANIGAPTGDVSGRVVFDFDSGKGGMGTLAGIDEDRGLDWREGAHVAHTGGGGVHLVFSYPGEHVKSRVGVLAGADTRGDGGYVILPPSSHASGGCYSWAPGEGIQDLPSPPQLPSWVRGLANGAGRPIDSAGPVGPREDGDGLRVEPPTPSQWGDIRMALMSLDFSDYSLWTDMGHALKTAEVPGSEVAFSEWYAWSEQDKRFSPREARGKWNGFSPRNTHWRAVLSRAQENGWVNNRSARFQREERVVAMVEESGEKLLKLPPLNGLAFPEHLLDTGPGLLADLCMAINDRTPKVQPVAALGASLTVLGALYGRRYRTNTDRRSNLYTILVGPSGCGKDGARGFLQKALETAGLGHFVGGEWASHRGLYGALSRQPALVIFADEFGDLIGSSTNRNAAGHMSGVPAELKKLYTSAGSVYKAPEYASAENRPEDLIQPHLCIVGTTTPQALYSAIDATALEGGLGNRLLVLPLEAFPPTRRTFDISIPDSIVETLKEHEAAGRPQGNLAALEGAHAQGEPREVRILEDAEDHLYSFTVRLEETAKAGALVEGTVLALWQRATDTAARLALIRAISRDPTLPFINLEDVTWGLEVACWAIRNLEGGVAAYGGGSRFEDQMKNVQRACSRLSRKDGTLSRRKLMRATRMPKRDLDPVIDHLFETGYLVQEPGTGETRYRISRG